ncbi:hypothetical protein D3C74_503780 [compost metagenome]
MVQTGTEQAIVSLTCIGLIDRFALQETFDHNKNIIENRYAQRQNRNENGQHRCLFECTVKCDNR